MIKVLTLTSKDLTWTQIRSRALKHKKIKKYQKSNLFIKTMDGTENVVSKMIEEAVKKGSNPIDILRLISELEGSSQMLNLIDEQEDKRIIDLLKSKYYKIYFSLKKLDK